MLWKFYKSDPDVCSFIFGTMHVATDEAYTYASIAQKYITQVSLYAGEMDLNEAEGQNMLYHLTLQNSVTFSSFFRPKQYEKYQKILLKTYKIDLKNYDTFTPFFLNNLLAELSLTKSKNEALDHFLWKYAMENNIEVKGVESFDDQLKILKSIPLDFQVKSFRSALKNISSFKSKLKKINQLYSKGDIQQIYKISKKSMGSIRKLMIYDRNKLMVERILLFSSQKPLFAAVGAAHMAGKKGILSLLKQQGYKVIQLDN